MTALSGIALVPGTAAGMAVIVRERVAAAPAHEDARTAREVFETARDTAASELRRRVELLAGGPAQEILRAHLTLIADPIVTAAISSHLDAGMTAAAALEQARAALVARFEALGDPLLRARAADLSDICDYIARYLETPRASADVPTERIICASSLSPAQVLHLADARPLAFVLESRADTSHAAILLQTLGIPTIIGVQRATALLRDGDRVLVNAGEGQVIVEPGVPEVRVTDVTAPAAAPCDGEPALTRDGVAIAVTATIAGAQDARVAIAVGADGIGLFRTEWLFMQAGRLPSEEDQFQVYRQVAMVAGDRPVTVRAFDLGGDKQPAALALPVTRNPALGLRGTRLALAYPELLETQIRAVVRAFDGRRVRVMLPMVTDPAEVMQVRRILDRTAGTGFEIGAMIETPAAAVMADEIAAVTDFLSLGTNDLTQYVLAADRDSDGGPSGLSPMHPAVLRLIRLAAAAAIRAGRPLSVCGEAARDPLVAPLLLGVGVTELSVAPNAIVAVKARVRDISIETVRTLVDELAALPTAAGVAARLRTLTRHSLSPDAHAARDAH